MMSRERRTRSSHPFVDVYRKARKGIVCIYTEKEEPDGFMPAPPFFFPQKPAEDAVALSMGTGFILDRSGLILTANHIIGDDRRITVRLHDGSVSPAQVIWNDKSQDIALLKISGSKPLTPLRLGSSRSSRVGEIVAAIGHPLGLKNTMTTGIISAKHPRLRFKDKTMEDILQTDCAINPGNSGGPLLNMRGRVVGINTFTAKDTSGLAFAMGIDGILKRIGSQKLNVQGYRTGIKRLRE